MNRAYRNENGMTYTILMGGVGSPALLVKHSDPDGFDFVVVNHLSETSWSNGSYHQTLLNALEDYRKHSREQEL